MSQNAGVTACIDGVKFAYPMPNLTETGARPVFTLYGSRVSLLGLDKEHNFFEDFELMQLNSVMARPGVVKAFHLHLWQTDIWTVLPGGGSLVVGMIDLRSESPTQGMQQVFNLGCPDYPFIRIPPGVAHGYMNVGSSPNVLMYFADKHYSASELDGYLLPMDLDGFDWGVS